MLLNLSSFSKELQHLAKETEGLFSGLEINEISQFINESYGGDDDSVMGSQEIINDIAIIKIHSSSINEYVISHELLHACFIGKGFPTHFFYGEENKETHNILYAQQSLYNTVVHKIIIAEQFKLNIKMKKELDDQIQNLIDIRMPDDDGSHVPSIDRIMRFFDFLVMYDYRKNDFEGHLKKCYPLELAYSKRLARLCLDTEYDTPYRTRRVLVKVFREFDSILKELRQPPFELNKLIAVGFVPGRNQLNRRVGTTFDVEKIKLELTNKSVSLVRLISKTDTQLSYCLYDILEKKEDYENLRLIEFYDKFKVKYQLR